LRIKDPNEKEPTLEEKVNILWEAYKYGTK
jgi:hypothetical protein